MTMFVRRLAAAGAVTLSVLGVGAAFAAPTAVQLVFESGGLKTLAPGATLSYRFARETDDKTLAPAFQDEVKLVVTAAEGGGKAATVAMFTGARAQSYGPLSADGNPVIIAVLEQDVREMQKLLGGSPYYIRNRMRDAINAGERVEPVRFELAGKPVDGWKVTLKPFARDAQRDKLKDFADRSYELTFSDAVPGGLYSLVTVTPRKSAETPLLVENLTFSGVTSGEDAK
ncbi:hypothetical protein GCM10008171_24390 [Methylopila jiangsuensis]|uniref:DUF3108 domain-containing protein n=1 Tax=Methylopila jiangsuensis TaxID=586230 RepID=A0A9W6N4B8_9HYPH|nr:hypothetical protein [Methylopila jiangsuensis]MDR6286475.1 hypothetical protein [Methylopila jiangsuensis]GLK77185.1 hypothetical protein GCM10008171_24390 [Methylopila jiangsuensis]